MKTGSLAHIIYSLKEGGLCYDAHNTDDDWNVIGDLVKHTQDTIIAGMKTVINTLRPGSNGWHFAYDIF